MCVGHFTFFSLKKAAVGCCENLWFHSILSGRYPLADPHLLWQSKVRHWHRP